MINYHDYLIKYISKLNSNNYRFIKIKSKIFKFLDSCFLIHDSGFSLIELLVVITLIGIIGTITSQVFILGIRSQAKSEIIKEVKQNGDYASSVLESMIRNALDIQASQCNTNTQSLTIVSQDGFATTFDCSGSSIASNSGVAPFPTISLPLTGSRVSLDSCNFRIVCPTPPLSPKYVFINFTLSQKGTNLPVEQMASLEYQTTVSLRNYQ